MQKQQIFIKNNRVLIFLILLHLSFSLLICGQTSTDKEVSPKVFLNHFFLIIDSSTYKNIVESDFIKNEFANFEQRTTFISDNESYTGAYIYGENTYFEFFDTSKKPSSMPVDTTSGIAFGVEQKGESKIIQKKLKEYKNAMYSLTTRKTGEIQVPWFFVTGVFYGKTKSNIFTWVMEYHEDFLKKWYPDLAPISPGITRKDVLKRYAAKITKPEETKSRLLKDVTEVNLSLKQQDSERLIGELTVFGYELTLDGNKKICIGPDIKLIIEIIDEEEGRITGVKMRLHHHKYKKASYQFGEKSRLILYDDKTATWIFY